MPNKCPPREGMVAREIDWTLSFKEIIIVTKAFFSEPSIEIYNNQRTNSYDGKQLVSETSLSSDCEMKADAASRYLTWDQALYIFFLLLLWLKGGKNNAWYIHLTSHQPPPNLHNLTSAWPVMLLANQRLPDKNQTLAGIMSLSKWISGKRKFLSTFRWRFL